ncbi:MAG: RHS repeat protein, partial [Verrucomicrobiae bacterium]|nr:RHS repeat protein [Verrucomicrobiae bacterium]
NRSHRFFDRAGRLTRTVSPRGLASTNVYDDRGRLAEWVDPSGNRWIYTYDGQGNIQSITDAKGGVYRMEYGSRNERTREENQDGKVWNYEFDALGRLQRDEDPNGLVKIHRFDATGRKLSTSYSTGRTDAIQYDENDNILILSRSGGLSPATLSLFTYDPMDRLTEYRGPYGKTVGYSYDAHGRRKTLVYPGNKVLTYEYDEHGRIRRYTDWLGKVSDFVYDDAGRLLSRTYPNDIKQVMVYDDAGHMTSLVHQKEDLNGTTPVVAYQYAYDANGNITSASEQGTLAWEVPEHLPNEHSEFTAAGRITSKTDLAESTGGLDFSYTFDEAGNMTHATRADDMKKFEMTYDEDQRTTSIELFEGPTSKVIENRYDALGRRISRTREGEETRFVHDLSGKMEHVLCETNASGGVANYLIHGPGGLHYRINAVSGTIECLHYDASANLVTRTDGDGVAEFKRAFSPFGVKLSPEDGKWEPYGFGGAYGAARDLAGEDLVFMRARYYDSSTRIFLGPDPVRHQTLVWTNDRYHYALGNPIAFGDPSGETLEVLAVLTAYYAYEQTTLKTFNNVAGNVDLMARVALGEEVSPTEVLFKVSGLDDLIGYVPGVQTYRAVKNGYSIARDLDNATQNLRNYISYAEQHASVEAMQVYMNGGGTFTPNSVKEAWGQQSSLEGDNESMRTDGDSMANHRSNGSAEQAFRVASAVAADQARLQGVAIQSGYSVEKVQASERSVGSKATSARSYYSGGKKVTVITFEKRDAASIKARDAKYKAHNGKGW